MQVENQRRFFPILLAGLCLALPAFAQTRLSNDVVFLRNGDRITGEIRSLTNGEFTIQPAYAKDAVVLDWSEVAKIESTQAFAVQSASGVRAEGLIHATREEGLTMEAGSSEQKIPLASITVIEPVGSTFWTNLHGSVDAGLSFTGSTSQQSATLQGSLTHLSAARLAKIDISDQFATQVNAKDTNEMLVQTSLYNQAGQSKMYLGAMANFLSSSKQEIALRSTIGAGAARHVVQSRRASIDAIAGLGFTNQANRQTIASTQRSFDGVLAVEAKFYRFSAFEFSTSAWIYPGLTDQGRLRMTLSQSLYYKLVRGPYLRFNVYDYFDNQPQIGTPSNNAGGVLSVGWAFH